MKKEIFCYLMISLFSSSLFSGTNPSEKNRKIVFTENKGQVADQNYKTRKDVLYSATSGALTFHVKNNGISYQLSRVDRWKEAKGKYENESHAVAEQRTIYRLDLNWLNANPYFTIETDEHVEGYTNYYLEQCPNGVLNVASYKGIWLKIFMQG